MISFSFWLTSFCSFCQNDEISSFWYISVGTRDTVPTAYIDYRRLPAEQELVIHHLNGRIDTVQEAFSNIQAFYSDNSLFVPLGNEQAFYRCISRGEISLYRYTFHYTNSDLREDVFVMQPSFQYSTPGTFNSTHIDTREQYLVIINQDTLPLNRATYKKSLWPKFREVFELNTREIERARFWEWPAVIDYYNGNFSHLVYRNGQKDVIFGLQPQFLQQELTSLQFFDFKGEQKELTKAEDLFSIAQFEYQGQTFQYILSNSLLKENAIEPKHSWKRISGAIDLYYSETIRAEFLPELKEIQGVVDPIRIVQLPNSNDYFLLTEKFFNEQLVPTLKENKSFVKYYSGSYDYSVFQPEYAISLYNYWAQKNPAR